SARSKLAAAVEQFGGHAGQNGVVDLRAGELTALAGEQAAFENAKASAAKFRETIDQLVQREAANAKDVVQQAGQQVASGKLVLMVLSFGAIWCALMIAWRYVGHSIAGRLTLLSSAMQSI